MDKDGQQYFAALEIKNVTVEDAGKYKVTAKNELGESNATITLNFDSKYYAMQRNKHRWKLKSNKKKYDEWKNHTHSKAFLSLQLLITLNAEEK